MHVDLPSGCTCHQAGNAVYADAVGWPHFGSVPGHGPYRDSGAVTLQHHHSELVSGAPAGKAGAGHDWDRVSALRVDTTPQRQHQHSTHQQLLL